LYYIDTKKTVRWCHLVRALKLPYKNDLQVNFTHHVGGRGTAIGRVRLFVSRDVKAKSFGLSLGLTFSALGFVLGLMASGLIEIDLVTSNINSAQDIN